MTSSCHTFPGPTSSTGMGRCATCCSAPTRRTTSASTSRSSWRVNAFFSRSTTVCVVRCEKKPSGGCAGQLFAGVVRGPDERTGLDVSEAHGHAGGRVIGKLLWRHPAVHGEMEFRRLQVLADRHEVDVCVPQILKRLGDLFR